MPLYAAGLWLKGLFAPRVQRLRGLVVSVGSLSTGGAGKTPVVMMVAEMLAGAGYRVNVLSRGYGRSGKGIERVDPVGETARFGDEPMLMARLGFPVWVGADRFRAGLAAEEQAESVDRMAHVLDDGYQHRGLGRDIDLVLLTRRDVEDGLLPAGDLREQLRALERAHILVLREEEEEELWEHVPAKKMVWVVRRKLECREIPGRPLVFCGIARPEGFLEMLAGVGVERAELVRFADHHAYGMRDVTGLIKKAQACGADYFVTTEKDAVKLTPAMRKRLEAIAPVVVAELRVTLAKGSVWDLGIH